jgi:hypothetical protein
MAGLVEVLCHGRAHDAQADESDFHAHMNTLLRCNVG